MHQKYLNDLIKIFRENADKENAIPMKKYMKNKFEFFGIKKPRREELTKEFLRSNGMPDTESIQGIIKELWKLPQREYQYIGQGLLGKLVKNLDKDFIHLFEYMIKNKSWWDTVDFIAINLVGDHLLKYPELIKPYAQKWISSDNMWLQRTAILFQLKYKENTDINLLFTYIKKCFASKEFFIQKAIGWALREYSKTNPKEVITFVNNSDLAPLSKREALKWLKNKEQI
jgi:3-methyladenine DNA glycosylase AlkD